MLDMFMTLCWWASTLLAGVAMGLLIAKWSNGDD